MNRNLSDKIAEEFYLAHFGGTITEEALAMWREARRIAAEREIVAFQEGWEAACQTYPQQLSPTLP